MLTGDWNNFYNINIFPKYSIKVDIGQLYLADTGPVGRAFHWLLARTI